MPKYDWPREVECFTVSDNHAKYLHSTPWLHRAKARNQRETIFKYPDVINNFAISIML